VFVLGVLLVVGVAVMAGGSQEGILPMLGLFAYAGFRVIPSFNRLTHLTNMLRVGIARSEPLCRDMDALRSAPDTLLDETLDADDASAPHPLRQRLVCEDLCFSYEAGGDAALSGVSVEVRAGASVAIVGPSGAGKSTLLDILLGVLDPSSGRVLLDGADLRTCRRAWQRRVGYVPQQVLLLDETLAENVALGVAPERIDRERVREALGAARLTEVVDRLPDGLDTRLGEGGVRLSGGERQRTAIARALYHEPDIVVFDEATSALDPETERDLATAINALSGERTVFVVAHRLDLARRCDQVIFIEGGRLVDSGSFDVLTARCERFRVFADAEDLEAEPQAG
jgi:ATP-binding cassette subfamily C protein